MPSAYEGGKSVLALELSERQKVKGPTEGRREDGPVQELWAKKAAGGGQEQVWPRKEGGRELFSRPFWNLC